MYSAPADALKFCELLFERVWLPVEEYVSVTLTSFQVPNLPSCVAQSLPKSSLVGDDNYKKDGLKFNAYRGDCYLCQFTHRINRNFNDPSAPYNDEIVDKNTWKENYDPTDPEKY